MLGTALVLLRSSLMLSLHLAGGIQSFPKPLTAAEERMYLERYAKGDLEARNILIERNLRLVAHMMKNGQCRRREPANLCPTRACGFN